MAHVYFFSLYPGTPLHGHAGCDGETMCTDTEGLIKIYMSFLSTFTNYSRWQNGHINRIYCAKDPQGHIITTIMDTNYLRYGRKKKTEENRRKMRDFVVFHTLPNVEWQLKSSFSSDINLETDSNLGHKLSPIRVRCVSFTCMSVHSAAARWVINSLTSLSYLAWPSSGGRILLGSYLPTHLDNPDRERTGGENIKQCPQQSD